MGDFFSSHLLSRVRVQSLGPYEGCLVSGLWAPGLRDLSVGLAMKQAWTLRIFGWVKVSPPDPLLPRSRLPFWQVEAGGGEGRRNRRPDCATVSRHAIIGWILWSLLTWDAVSPLATTHARRGRDPCFRRPNCRGLIHPLLDDGRVLDLLLLFACRWRTQHFRAA